MHPQIDHAVAGVMIAEQMRRAEQHRAASAVRPARQRIRFSLRAAFGRRAVAGAAR
jgi:hypothetical protein